MQVGLSRLVGWPANLGGWPVAAALGLRRHLAHLETAYTFLAVFLGVCPSHPALSIDYRLNGYGALLTYVEAAVTDGAGAIAVKADATAKARPA